MVLQVMCGSQVVVDSAAGCRGDGARSGSESWSRREIGLAISRSCLIANSIIDRSRL